MEKKKKVENKKVKKWICIVGYAVVPVFFAVLYLLMTETYEDILHYNSGSEMSVGEIINHIYNYIPRVGEFYQHIATHFMSPQVSFGLDIIFRLVTAMLASGIIYFSTMFVLGRRLHLRYKDVIIYLSILLCLMISIFSETFMYRFSFAHNYILGLLIMVGFLLLFRLRLVGDRWWKLVGAGLLGFLLGISTELVPVAFIILIFGFTGVGLIKKKIVWADFLGKYKLLTFAMIGLFLGLAFFYLGRGIEGRTSGMYAIMYDYVSPMGLFKNPLSTISKLVSHLWYNVRYVFFAIPLMSMYIFVEGLLFRKKANYLLWQSLSFLFCVLFIGATSLIAVDDALYARFMSPVFIAVLLSTMLFVLHILDYAKVSECTLRLPAIVAIILGGVLIVDTACAFAIYNVKVAPLLEAIHYNPGGDLVIDYVDAEGKNMSPSPIFRLKQLPPFDWGPPADYTKFGL